LWHSTKQYFNLSVRKNTIVPILMIALSLIPFYLNPNRFFDFIYIIIAEVILLLLLPKDFKEEIASKIKKVTQKFRAT
jgi:1-acyl-sn-glycerol-3-phosphate acyltransferase